MTEEMMSADDYFDGPTEEVGEPENVESNGDATEHGDVDSVADDVDPNESSPLDDDGELEIDDVDPEGEAAPVEELPWIPGFENRFRVGEEAKIADAYRELETFSSQKINQVQQEAQQQQAQAIANAQQQWRQEQEQKPLGMLEVAKVRQDILQLAQSDPHTAYQAALETGDAQTVEKVIQQTANGNEDFGVRGNPALASQMSSDYAGQMQTSETQQLREEFSAYKQQMNQQSAKQSVENAWGGFAQDNPDYLAVGSQMAQLIEQSGNAADVSTPEKARQYLNNVYELALGRAIRSGSYTPAVGTAPVAPDTSLRDEKKGAQVAGRRTPSQRNESKPSASDEYADSLMNVARENTPNFNNLYN